MKWSSLLPSTWNPLRILDIMRSTDTFLQGLTDAFILTTVYGGLVMLVWVAWRMVLSRRESSRYLKAIPRSTDRAAFTEKRHALVARTDLPLLVDFNALLVEVPQPKESAGSSVAAVNDASEVFNESTLAHGTVEVPQPNSPLDRVLRRVGDASEVFNESTLAHGIVGNRLVLAVPGILTGLGVLGTFVGLQLGIGSLDLNDLGKLDQSIKPLIQGCATAFSTSVWGVVCSLCFIIAEKFLESGACRPIRRIASRLNLLIPRFTPEESMVEMQRSSGQTEKILNGLALAIGDQMQKAMERLGGSITEAVRDALGGQAQDLGKMSADLMSVALTAELAKLQDAVTGMAERFGTEFNGASGRLQQTVSGLEPVVKTLGDTVNGAQAVVRDAVDKLNAHEAVMAGMADAARQMDEAAGRLAALGDNLELAGQRNLTAAEAQEKAAESNISAAAQFERIGERLPEVRQTIEDGARIIGSLGQPLIELSELLKKTPEVFDKQAADHATSEEKRSSRLLVQTESLANAVAAAADKFSEVQSLGEHLAASAQALKESGLLLNGFGNEVARSMQSQASAASASERAAAAGLKAADALHPIPERLDALTGQLSLAGSSVQDGAEAAQAAYMEVARFQREWFSGVEKGLGMMRDQLQHLIKEFGQNAEGTTVQLTQKWTGEVEKSLTKYSVQVQTIENAIAELTAKESKR